MLGNYKPIAAQRYGVTSICLFGSVAREEQSDNSDVDVCYSGKALSLVTLDRFQSELEQLFGCQVDLVRMRPNMNAVLKQRIINEGVYA